MGFISAAFSVDVMRAHLGRARTMMLANGTLAVAFLAIICTPPFPVVVASFFLLGLGFASNLALGNVFTGNLQNSTQLFGIMHGCYGIGGTLGPLVATAMVTSGGLIWSRFYILTLAIAAFNIGFTGWSFWHYEKESLPSGDMVSVTRLPSSHEHSTRLPTTDHGAVRMAQPAVRPSGQFSSMAKAVKNKVVLLGALFIFAYQGAEVSISGWVISFLLTFRNGNPASIGYVTAGFWGGITVGRFLLTQPAHKIGEKKFVYSVVVGAAAFQLLVWFVPNIIGDAVAVVSFPHVVIILREFKKGRKRKRKTLIGGLIRLSSVCYSDPYILVQQPYSHARSHDLCRCLDLAYYLLSEVVGARWHLSQPVSWLKRWAHLCYTLLR